MCLLPASTDKDLRDALHNVAIQNGADLLPKNKQSGWQPQDWNKLEPEDQISRLMRWLDRGPGFRRCIVMFDDLDNLHDERHTFHVWPKNATVLVSARDPVETRKSGCEIKSVSSLDPGDMAALLKSKAEEIGLPICQDQHSEQLQRLAFDLGLHAFAACAASTSLYYLSLENPLLPVDQLLLRFTNSLEESGPETYERLLGLELADHRGDSIMKLYEGSLGRMRLSESSDSQQSNTLDLLELMVFMQPAPFLPNTPQQLHIFDFISKVNIHFNDIIRCHPQLHLNSVFQKQPGVILHAFIKASLGIIVDRPVLIPAIWRACVLQVCKDEKRRYWLRQILLVCFHVCQEENAGKEESLAPYVENCIRIANRFGINYKELLVAGEEQRAWIAKISPMLREEG